MLLLIAAIGAPNAHADDITFTHTGVGSGTIGATSFTGAAFTITDIANTSSVTSFSEGFFVNDTSASISISGVGTFDFLTPTETFVNNLSELVGFGHGSLGADLYDGPANAAFDTWNMLSSIGAISGTASLFQWTFSPVNTSGGVLAFPGTQSSETAFTATIATASAVPEPSTFVLMLTMIALVLGMRKRIASGLLPQAH